MTKRFLILVIIMFTCSLSYGQATVLSNNSVTSTDFVGWNAIPTFELDLRHEADYRMVFGTNNQDRFGILENAFNNRIVLRSATPISNARLSVKATFNGTLNTAVRSEGIPVLLSSAGNFQAEGAPDNVGARGTASNGPSADNFGVAGFVCTFDFARVFAIYGLIKEDCSGWAGYFNGNTFTPGGAWTSSDANLKTNIQELEGGTATLELLTPKTYNFDNHEGLVLPEGNQFGLLAQELETAVPHAVRGVTAANLDQEGTYSFKAVNYQQLIPVLISAFQERQADLDQQQELIAQLEVAIEAAEMQMSQISTE